MTGGSPRTRYQLIVLLSGHVAAGKTTLAEALASAIPAAALVSSKRILLELDSRVRGRTHLQKLGATLDEQTGGAWLAEVIVNSVQQQSIIIDAVRTLDQVRLIRALAVASVHVHVQADLEIRAARYESHATSGAADGPALYEEVLQDSTESRVDELGQVADVSLNTGSLSAEDCGAMAEHAIRLLQG